MESFIYLIKVISLFFIISNSSQMAVAVSAGYRTLVLERGE
jgi:hypothetical protein